MMCAATCNGRQMLEVVQCDGQYTGNGVKVYDHESYTLVGV